MKKIETISEKEYVNFFNTAKYNHFLQSYEWGQACKARNLNPVYLGLKDEKNIITAACLAFKKKTPLNMCYFYAPRGVIIDYHDQTLLSEFTNALKTYLKEQNAIYFKMDPGLRYQEIDDEANPVKDGFNNYELFNYMLKLGYKHQGFNKLYERNQPRYTFHINTRRNFEEIEKDMNKSYLKTIKRSFNYDLDVSNNYDNETFYRLMKEIANRDNFNGYSKEFYEAFDKAFTKYDNARYVTIKIYPDKIIEKTQKDILAIKKDIEEGKISDKKMNDTKNVIARLEKDLEVFKPYEGKHPNGLVSLILICCKTNHAMWTLYIGNNELATYTFAVNRAYYEAIKLAHAEKMDYLDLFGTSGDPHTTYHNLGGIHEYKRKIGGTYIEFFGELDLVNKPFWYKTLPIMLNIYRKIKK